MPPESKEQTSLHGLRGLINNTALKTALLSGLIAALLAPAAPASDLSDINKLMRAGHYGDALAKTEAVLAKHPRDAQLRFTKGLILAEQNRPAEAIAVFTKLTEDFPDLPEPYNNLAVLYAASGQYDQARTALDKAMRTNPAYATAQENLGDVYARMASQAYDKALQIDPASARMPQLKLTLLRGLNGNAGSGSGTRLASAGTTVNTAPSQEESQSQARARADAAAAEEQARAKAVAAEKAAQQAAADKAAAQKEAMARAEKAAADKAAEKLAAEKATADKLAADKAAAQQQEQAERLAREQAARAEKERIAAEKAEKAKAAADKLAAEKAEKTKAAADKLAAEKAEKAEKAKAVQAKAAADRLAAEKAAAEKERAEKAHAADAEQDKAAILTALNTWAKAWSSKDVRGYLAHYAGDFDTPRGVTRKAWAEERRARIEDKDRIEVRISNAQIAIKGNTATVRYRQIYNSDRLTLESRKTLIFTKQGNRWLIKQERSGG